ncbi:MAG: hypothetical protein K6G40_05090, partial [Eubacterium sp.]|nr:hypothetical protein [Eubacterium sp.]
TDNTMTFVKNPNYWQTDSDGVQLPYLDEVNLVYFADAETTMASFISGDIDAVITSGTYFNADESEQIATALGEDYYTNTFYAAPMSIGLKQGSNPVEALTDVKVREALQYAIDLEALSDYMGYGYTEEDELKSKISSLFSSNTEWSNIDNWDDEMLESYTTYDPEKAKELLAEVGYADGFDFEVTIFSMLPTELFQLVSEYLAEVGVNMTVTVGNTPQDMTSVGGDETNPSCVFYTIGGDSVSGVGMSILRDGQTNYIKQNESIIDELATTFINATSTDEQIEAAHALDDEYMSQHYVLLITYCERYQSFFRNSFHGLKGGTPLANYYYGYMLARCWTDN